MVLNLSSPEKTTFKKHTPIGVNPDFSQNGTDVPRP